MWGRHLDLDVHGEVRYADRTHTWVLGSADQGRALDDVRATRDCPLKCPSLDGYRVFIRIVLVDGSPGFKWVSCQCISVFVCLFVCSGYQDVDSCWFEKSACYLYSENSLIWKYLLGTKISRLTKILQQYAVNQKWVWGCYSAEADKNQESEHAHTLYQSAWLLEEWSVFTAKSAFL